MTTVFVLIECDWEEQPVIGVFSTLEGAKTAARPKHQGKWEHDRYHTGDRVWSFVSDAPSGPIWTIEEHDLDQPASVDQMGTDA